MRLVMLGTGPFAVPTFRWLLASGHDVPALVTRPTPPPRGRRKTPLNPMRDTARVADLPVLEPADINADDGLETLQRLRPELLVVCDYGQILSPEALAMSRLGGINLHGSLLPRYRGAAPINWCLWQGDEETGVTVIHMTPRLDAGPCLVQRRLRIAPDDDAVTLEARLAELGVDAVREALDLLARWDGASPLGQQQDASQATRAPRLRKEQGHVDWHRPATALERQVRAFKPWPGSFTNLPREGAAPLRLILDEVAAVPLPPPAAPPGTIVRAGEGELIVATGEGGLAIRRLQPAGKRSMQADEFLRGHSLGTETRFD